MNYLGDWDTVWPNRHRLRKYGSHAGLEKDVIKHLFDIYAAINKDASTDPAVKTSTSNRYKRMEDGDQDALCNWRMWREMSVREYEKEWERLNVKFDMCSGESEVGKESLDVALGNLESMSLMSEWDDVKLVKLEKWRLDKAVVHGTLVYLTRDIGCTITRYETYKFDKMKHVIFSQQDLHVSQFFVVLELPLGVLAHADHLQALTRNEHEENGGGVFGQDH
ncbi:hypothetical protein CVT25_007677 [Psilocybe cyanescens]|uniref:Arginyl-tRNA synthetase catalytic core domain-containing protein n=1 Tax=Psilocybe cyanescens TaxID=93625 RepID=A0A409XVK2_PSICY|nr:hypothetical protein CVT25_007677 [Psilocybe cyanescens]